MIVDFSGNMIVLGFPQIIKWEYSTPTPVVIVYVAKCSATVQAESVLAELTVRQTSAAVEARSIATELATWRVTAALAVKEIAATLEPI